MNWSYPLLIAQDTTQAAKQAMMDRLSELNNGTSVPESAIERTTDPSASYWFPEQASSFAADIDFLYYAILWISTVFFAAIVFFMVYFCIRYRRKGGVIDPEPSPSHNTWIEILWSVGPSIILVWMFYAGAEGFFDMRVERPDAEEIHVAASRWNWVFTYPDGDSSSELHLVNNKPVKLIMHSNDVLHGMFIPAFRQKMDIVPGRYTYAYLTPIMEGEFRLACTEYCGTGHSKMRTMCKVHASDQARKESTQWIEPEHPAWENGERIYKINCSGCHKIDQDGTGPQFKGLWGRDETILNPSGGTTTVKVDDNYILESIWFPDRKVVDGFGPVSKMNSFKGKLTQDDVNQVIEYMKYLDDPDSVSNEPEGEVEAAGN